MKNYSDCFGNIIFDDMQEIYNRGIALNDNLRESKVYISGAAGMIASYLVYYLIYLNEVYGYNIEIYAGIRNEKKALWRFKNYIDKHYFHIIKDDVVYPLSNDIKFDYVIHAASLASPQYYGKMPVETMLPNIIGTYNLLNHAKNYGAKSFVFFSSGAVYGINKTNFLINENMNGEFDFIAPQNVYGESKRSGEALCSAFYKEYGVPVKSVRIFHTYGPTLDLNGDKRAFSDFVNKIVNNENIILRSDGRQYRQFCYLTDAILAILFVLINGQNGESYNLANNKEFVTIRDLAERLVQFYPEKHLKVIINVKKDDGYLPLDNVKPVLSDTAKIERLGCDFRVSIEEGFKRTISHFINLYNAV